MDSEVLHRVVSGDGPSSFPVREVFPVRDLQAALAASAASGPQVFTGAERPFVVKHINEAWCNLCGFSKDEAIGRTIGELIQGPQTCKATLDLLHNAVKLRVPITLTLINYTKAGVPFTNQLSLEPLIGGGGEYAFVATAHKVEEGGAAGAAALAGPSEAAGAGSAAAAGSASGLHHSESMEVMRRRLDELREAGGTAAAWCAAQPSSSSAAARYAACCGAGRLLAASGASSPVSLRETLVGLVPLLPSAKALPLLLVIQGVLRSPMQADVFESAVRNILGVDTFLLQTLLAGAQPPQGAAGATAGADADELASMDSSECTIGTDGDGESCTSSSERESSMSEN